MIPDLRADEWTDDALQELLNAVLEEQNRRHRLETIPAQIDDLVNQHANDLYGSQPDSTDDVTAFPTWRKPLGSHDTYPLGWVVNADGVLRRSKVALNWYDVTDDTYWETVDEAVAPSFDTVPWEEGVTYQTDTYVTYQGATYRCVQTHTSQLTFAPGEFTRALWTKVS